MLNCRAPGRRSARLHRPRRDRHRRLRRGNAGAHAGPARGGRSRVRLARECRAGDTARRL